MDPESIGRRIAQLRQQRGWTQEALAARIAISRVAVSHIELDLSVPEERTICLLAGLFKVAPHDLVAGTTYPHAKAERLPAVVCCHTPLELDLALLQRDLAWLARLEDGRHRWTADVWETWRRRLAQWEQETADERDHTLIATARQKLRVACVAPTLPALGKLPGK